MFFVLYLQSNFLLYSPDRRFFLVYRSYHETSSSRSIYHNHSVDLRITGNLSVYTLLSFCCCSLAASVHSLLHRCFLLADNRTTQWKHQWNSLTEHLLLWKHLHLPNSKSISGYETVIIWVSFFEKHAGFIIGKMHTFLDDL